VDNDIAKACALEEATELGGVPKGERGYICARGLGAQVAFDTPAK